MQTHLTTKGFTKYIGLLLLFMLLVPTMANAGIYPQGNTVFWNVSSAISADTGSYPYNSVRGMAADKGKVFTVVIPLNDGSSGPYGYTGHAQLHTYEEKKGAHSLIDIIPEISWSGGLGRYLADARVATDGTGNVFVAGAWGTANSAIESWLVKYGNWSIKAWSKKISTQDITSDLTRAAAIKDIAVKGVAADNSGNIYVVGNTFGTAITDRGIFIIKYDTSGTKLWSEELVTSTTAQHEAGSVSVSSSGSVYFAGVRDGTPFLIKYGLTNGSTDGTREWLKSAAALFESVAVDRTGNIYGVGNGNLSKFDTTGNSVWSISDSGTTRFYSSSFSITVESDGSIYVANGGGLSKYNSSGVNIWRKDSFTLDGSLVTAVAADNRSTAPNVYFGGATGAGADNKTSLTRLTGTDTDGDGLYDIWETDGYTVNVNGTDVFVNLPAMGANPKKKDIFVEIDYTLSKYRPKRPAINKVIAAFAKAPVKNPTATTPDTDPDYSTGITLHVDAGPFSWMNPVVDPVTGAISGTTWNGTPAGDLSKSNKIGLPDNQAPLNFVIDPGTGIQTEDWTPFDLIKTNHFSNSGRELAFHYCIFGNEITLNPNDFGTSGISRGITASDFLVTLGNSAWGNTANEQAGTFMHELGHNLGLFHGGDNDEQYKPNYLSVMNYSFQLGLLTKTGGGNFTRGPFDYSRFKLLDLNENSLVNSDGINVTTLNPAQRAFFDTLGTTFWLIPNTTQRLNMVNWDNLYNIAWDIQPRPAGTTGIDINVGDYNVTPTPVQRFSLLTSFEDWPNLKFRGGSVGGLGIDLPTFTEHTDPGSTPSLFAAMKGVGFDVTVSSSEATVLAGSSFTITFTVTNTGSGPDTYNLQAVSDKGWADVNSVPASVSLASGASIQITLPVTVPGNATPGDVDETTLTAVSQSNSYAEDQGRADTVVKRPPPVADNQTITVLPNRASSFTLTGSSPNGTPLTYDIVSQPTHGTLSRNPGSRFGAYTPTGTFTGTDSFTFTVNDGFLTSTIATVTVNVQLELPRIGYTTIPTDYNNSDGVFEIMAPATSANGAAVWYKRPTADDSFGGLNVSCQPAPGSVFPAGMTPPTCTMFTVDQNGLCRWTLPVGITQVDCSATNAAGTSTSSFNVVVTSLTDGVAQIAAGPQHTLLLHKDGMVRSTGKNIPSNNPDLPGGGDAGSGGMLGIPLSMYGLYTQAGMYRIPTFTNVRAVAAGGYFSAAVKADGTVWTWGGADYGVLGTGNSRQLSPTQVFLSPNQPLTGMSAIAAGRTHILALSTAGTVYAWGNNAKGQIGIGTADATVPTPTLIPGLSNVIGIAAGAYHNIALKADGTVWTWGSNNSGQLGIGSTIDQPAPVQVTQFPAVDWSAALADCAARSCSTNSILGRLIAAGANHTLAVNGSGELYAWGDNTFGQFGNGTTTGSSTPVYVGHYDNVRTLSAQGNISSLIKEAYDNTTNAQRENEILVWGCSPRGGITGHGWYKGGDIGRCTSPSTPLLTPTQVMMYDIDQTTYADVNPRMLYAHDIATSDGDIFVVKTDGTVWTSGNISGYSAKQQSSSMEIYSFKSAASNINSNFLSLTNYLPLDAYNFALNSTGVTPTRGSDGTQYEYQVVVNYPKSTASYYYYFGTNDMQVCIDGTCQDMVLQSIFNTLVSKDSGLYAYSTTLAPGNHNFYFKTRAGDTALQSITCRNTWPFVTKLGEVCTDQQLAPFSGPTVAPPPVMKGDVNSDQLADVFDALLTLQYVQGIYKPANEATFKSAADVNPLDVSGKPLGDSVVNVLDALGSLRHAVGVDPW